MHMYWDQATVLRQIGVLPNSLYCKSNSSEVTLPVLGPRITDRLQEPYNNLVLNGMDGDSDSGEYRLNLVLSCRPLIRLATCKLVHPVLPNFIKFLFRHTAPTAAAPEAVMTKPHHSASDIFNQHELPAAVRPQSGQSDMSYSNNNIFGSAADPITGSRPSSRVIHRPGGPSSNIFSTEPEPLKTGVAINPQRYHSNVVFGGPEEQPLPTQQPQQMQYLEREAPAAAAPSSVADPVTGSRPSSKVIHRPGGPTNDIFNMEPQAAAGSRPRTGSNGRRDPNWSSINAHEEVPLPTTQRKHASFGQNGTQSRGEYGVGGGIGMRTGRGGYHNPNETQHEAEDRKAAAAAAEAAAVVAASGARGMVGAGRNHNAMSEEAPLKPSSKVLAPPGGKTSVFFG
ncbi:hypothetical protein BC830DRAFT_710271 [Chytriomyces sp. MP71]|nr:hypothetical protein BC830DRAFT_710271 [Chytriomyces sp. MP71]